MQCKTFRSQLAEGKTFLGLCNMLPCSAIIEEMCRGCDFVWIDLQHGMHDFASAADALRMADRMGVASIVRSYSHDPGVLGKLADLRPTAVMVPMINTPEQAEQIVQALRFSPRGIRSYGGRRVIDLEGREYYQKPDPAIILQIETSQAVENAESIAATDGADMLFFGPDDMRVSLKIPINTPVQDNEQLRQAAKATSQAFKNVGKYGGIVAATPESFEFATSLGYQLIVAGADNGFVKQGAAAKLESLRPAGQNNTSPTGGIY